MARVRLFPAIVAVLTACGRGGKGAEHVWVDLSRGLRPVPLQELALELESHVDPPRPGRLVEEPDEDGPCFELVLAPEAWELDSAEGAWRTSVPTGGALFACGPETLVVANDDGDLVEGRPRPSSPGHFWRKGATLWVTGDDETNPPPSLRMRQRLDVGRDEEGRRVAQGDLSCQGFLVFPGRSETLAVDVPPGSLLSFATVSPDPLGQGERFGPTTFRVRLDGRTLLEHRQAFTRPVRSTWHRIELGVSGHHELAFEIDGEAPALIATPELRPAEIGAPAARPWSDERPDLVLVLCDTFRADNLEAWGGRPELAPALNRFVERSVRFLDARSAAAWTLPSIGTVLSGVFPGQHGATDFDRALAPGIQTAAEVLARGGYRTAAVTDGGFFSREFGQDQGFEWFEEVPLEHWNLCDTIARIDAQRAADDGRPLFLVLHTYRVHGPMRVGPEEDPGPPRERRAELKRKLDARREAGEEISGRAVALEYIEQGRLIYEDAVQDLDRKLGVWLEELERDGFFERGLLVLTADHGNARGEHDQIGHGGSLYDVKLRVPLAVAGRGLEPRAVPGLVSLVNVAPTFVRAAGLVPPAEWVGRSLLEETGSSPLFAFDLMAKHQEIALYSGGKKLMAPDVEALRAGVASHAFDLERDPGEEVDLVSVEDWPGELGRGLADEIEALTMPVSDASLRELPDHVLEQLEDIGYAR